MKKYEIDGQLAREIIKGALLEMNTRTGWEFPEEIENFILDLVEETGIIISDENMPSYIVDNMYINGCYGLISDLTEDEKIHINKDDCMIWNESKNFYVMSL